MNANKLTLMTVFVLVMISACTEEPEYGGFVGNSSSGSEDSGNQSITIDLGITTTAATTISYRVGGSAALDGDYRITSLTSYNSDALNVTVPAGQSTATISFEILDDNQVEYPEVIYFEITAISDASIAENFRQAFYGFEITDNDEPQGSGMQVDLSWYLGNGVRISAADFDLYLADAVTIDSAGVVSDYHLVEGVESVHASGFETIVIPDEMPDQQYYIIIKYVAGSSEARLTLDFNSTQLQRRAAGRVLPASVGTTLYYGPLTKSGTYYSFR